MMNLFRLAGDMCHVLSIVVLLLRLRVTKNAIGISVKTQELYLIVFITRYLDLFTTFYSVYNSVMKLLYISATAYIIYMIRGTEPFKTNYDVAHDSFLHWKFAVVPCVILAVVTNFVQGFNFVEVRFSCVFFGSASNFIFWIFHSYFGCSPSI
jgi:ER lumen protein retaining receptor